MRMMAGIKWPNCCWKTTLLSLTKTGLTWFTTSFSWSRKLSSFCFLFSICLGALMYTRKRFNYSTCSTLLITLPCVFSKSGSPTTQHSSGPDRLPATGDTHSPSTSGAGLPGDLLQDGWKKEWGRTCTKSGCKETKIITLWFKCWRWCANFMWGDIFGGLSCRSTSCDFSALWLTSRRGPMTDRCQSDGSGQRFCHWPAAWMTLSVWTKHMNCLKTGSGPMEQSGMCISRYIQIALAN